jgi:hypothetical protein
MDGDILLTLSLAQQYGYHANFAGTPRQAIADGYSCVDAVFTALLKHKGLKQPRNHKAKLDLVQEHFPNIFDAVTIADENSTLHIPGTDWDSIEAYYREWLSSRYDAFEMSAALLSSRVREALNILKAAIRHIAKEEGVPSDDLDTIVSKRAQGFDSSQVQMAVGDAHDRLFSEAEDGGLGVKMAAATNYCELDIMAGDELTQSIIRDDAEIANEAARVYHSFVELVEKMQEKRLAKIAGGKPLEQCTPAEISKAPDFMFSMKARYHGGTPLEMAARMFGRLTKDISELLEKIIPTRST